MINKNYITPEVKTIVLNSEYSVCLSLSQQNGVDVGGETDQEYGD